MEAAEKQHVGNYVQSFSDDLRIFQEAFLLERTLGTRELSAEKVEERMKLLGIDLPGPRFCAVIFAPYLMEKEAEDIDGLLIRIVHLVHQGYSSRGLTNYTVSDSYCNAVAILSLPSDGASQELDKITKLITSEIISTCEVKMFVGVGESVERFVDINRSAHSASTALAYKYSFAEDYVVRARDVVRYYHSGSFSLRQHYDWIMGCFYDGNLTQMSKRLQDLYAIIRGSSKNELDSMRNICIELTAGILRQAYEMEIKYPAEGIYTSIAQVQSSSELIKDLLNLSAEILDRINTLKNNRSKQIVRLAEGYIDRNLCNQDLTIQSVSDYVDLSQAYFSSIFFKEKGVHLNEYINSKRIELAKRLLLNSNSKVSNISQQLGFSSPSYFNTIFKKYTGSTPQKYRENMH